MSSRIPRGGETRGEGRAARRARGDAHARGVLAQPAEAPQQREEVAALREVHHHVQLRGRLEREAELRDATGGASAPVTGREGEDDPEGR